MTDHPSQSDFERHKDAFKSDLERLDLENLETTTLHSLRRGIIDTQSWQHSQRQLRDLNRIEPFLESTISLNNILNNLISNNDVLSVIWGPVKFLLEETSKYVRAFNELLDVYEKIGSSLPHLEHFQNLFRDEPQMIQILVDVYKIILDSHILLLEYFKRPQWQEDFDQTWKSRKKDIEKKAGDIARSRSVFGSQANPAQIEDFRRVAEASRQEQNDQFEQEELRRLEIVNRWLKASDVETDQHDLSQRRAEYPGTGDWLFDNSAFYDWFKQFPAIPPLLWLHGVPGSGKTILASGIVERAQNLPSPPTVLFFYCKQDNPERNNFLSIARTFLKQLLQQDRILLATLYPKCCRSGEPTLTSPDLVKELLQLALEKCKGAYIVIDGLDECPRDQRKIVTHWFRRLVDELPLTKPEQIRCLFISQHDGPATKDFSGLASLKLGMDNNRNDIELYSKREFHKIKDTFGFSEAEANRFTTHVADSTEGIFLLARLIWANLSAQTSRERFEEELRPDVFPKEINAAYDRIMVRLTRDLPEKAADDILMLLSWLVCAKRPFKWHEIQAMKSIHLDNQSLAFERKKFVKAPKDLCGALVEVRSDGKVELVHLTVKFFLTERYGIDLAAEEIKLGRLCIDYLNLPAFGEEPTRERVLTGDYAFMDYAVIYWLQHVEAGGTLRSPSHDILMDELQESLEIFTEQHWCSPNTRLPPLAKRHRDKLDFFRDCSFYPKLEQAVTSTRRQLRSYIKKEDTALNLADLVDKIRDALEKELSHSLDDTTQQVLEERYGVNLFKCPRFNCRFFTDGFSTGDQKNKHIDQHDRPFRCADEQCIGYHFGYVSDAELQKHLRDSHAGEHFEDDEFPTNFDVEHAIIDSPSPVEQAPASADDDDQPGEQNEEGNEPGPTAPPPRVETTIAPVREAEPRRRSRQTEFKCPSPNCGRVYSRKYNLTSHLATHGEKRHQCDFCDQAFARFSDLTRHQAKHTGEKRFVCGGQLNDGTPWGCGRSFARADILKNHYKSRFGKACIEPYNRQQEMQEQGVGQEERDRGLL